MVVVALAELVCVVAAALIDVLLDDDVLVDAVVDVNVLADVLEVDELMLAVVVGADKDVVEVVASGV